MATQPTGTVTSLFSDIEGSTRLWEQYPTLMRNALACHDDILRKAVLNHRGYVVKMRGDGIHAAFGSALDAVDAALAIQRALHAEEWGEIGELCARISLHTGAVEERDADYFGPAVNRAARLLSTAHGQQTLLSGSTRELVFENLPPGAILRDMGIHRLKDLIQPEHIYQLTVPDLPADFLPLITLDSHPNNLPVQPTPLIGREHELAAARDLLLRNDVRMMTLTGPGGIGKTRLGLQIAADLCDQFEDGAFFVNLAPITNSDLIIATIAQALGVKERGGQTLLKSLIDHLRDVKQLLVLDNFEQVISAAVQVAELLAACSPALKILVTSREPLHTRGEREFPVPPLALLRPYEAYEAGRDPGAAVALFAQRAQAVKPDFVLTRENAPAVAAIVSRLDGLPLAIELAAARCKFLSPQVILARLTNRLALLTSGPRDLPSRHHTLRNAIAWSYDLLDPAERTLFERLSIFTGGFSCDACEAVCCEGLSLDIQNALESLATKSLLRILDIEAGGTRFGMLETIREYAIERMNATHAAGVLQKRHAEYFEALAQEAETHLDGANQTEWLARLEQEHDNLRAALTWCVDHTHNELALRLSSELAQFWRMHCYFSEGRAWLTKTLELTRDRADLVPVRIKALNGAGYLAYRQSDLPQALALFREGLALARRFKDKASIAMALNGLGNVAWTGGDPAEARVFYESSLAIRREIKDRAGIGISLSNLGNIAWSQCDFTNARAYYEEGIVIGRELGDLAGVEWSLNVLGGLAITQQDYPAAHTYLEEGWKLLQDSGNRWGRAEILNSIGMLARYEGDYEKAEQFCRESLALCREIGDEGGCAEALKNLGIIAFDRNDCLAAQRHFQQGLEAGQRAQHKPAIAAALCGLGLVAYGQSDFMEAHHLCLQSLSMWFEIGYKPEIARCLEKIAGINVKVGKAQHAVQLMSAAAAVREAVGAPLPSPEQAQYMRAYTEARTQLGEDQFDLAWAQGHDMTVERIIASETSEG